MELTQDNIGASNLENETRDTRDLKHTGIEWPTLGLIGACIVAMPLLTYFANAMPLALAVLLLSFVLAMQSSLQHEVLHGHPFHNELLNEALVFLPAGLWVPYRRFKDTHLQHHFDPNLTDPYDDPESNFLDPKVWHTMGPLKRLIYRMNNTLLGRMIIGPVLGMLCFYKSDLKEVLQGNGRIIWAYVLHFVGFVPLFWWLTSFSTMPLWAYALAAYFGMSLLKIRTFLEHQAHEKVPGRTVIIEDRGLFSLLFLNNNFHLVHHAHPKVSWYRLPKLYAARQAEYLQMNNEYTYKNYAEVFQRYLLNAKDPVPHPLRPNANESTGT